jgi:phenylacetate-CoA ligase
MSMGRQISPRFVVCSGEFLSSTVQKEIECYFGTRVLNQYGSNEVGTIGFECMEGQGMHVNADTLVLETRERDGPAGPGKPGNVLLTNLENQAMPLVRYQIGDVATLNPEGRCGCGSSFPRLKEILGRSSEGLVASDGARVPVGAVCDEFESNLGMRDFQLTQRSLTRFVARLRSSDNNPQTVERVTRYLTEVIGTELDVEVTEWAEEDMPPKYRPVVSEIAR